MSGLLIQMTGLSGAGKTTLSNAIYNRLKNNNLNVEIIDGDEYRENLCKDLGFSKQDRNTNIRRLGFVGKILARNNVVAIMAVINPYEDIRQELKQMGEFVKTVYIKCNLNTLKNRDPKGLYKKALSGEIKNFTGISDPFEEPINPDLVIETDREGIDYSADKLYNFIIDNI